MTFASIDHLVGSGTPASRPRVAVSSCLLGINVRYDGGHRREAFVADVLGPRVDWIRVCPEVEIGLGTPRDPIDLHATGDPRRPKLLQGDRDLTSRMRSFALGRIAELRAREIDGYILKARSPSCGLAHARLVRPDGYVERVGTGIFAQALKESWPELPMFDETDLDIPLVGLARAEWIFVMHRFRVGATDPEGLMRFHGEHEERIGLRDRGALPELRSVLASAGEPSERIRQYARRLSRAFASIPAR